MNYIENLQIVVETFQHLCIIAIISVEYEIYVTAIQQAEVINTTILEHLRSHSNIKD